MYGDKYFPVSALRLWNKLPNRIKLAGSQEICCKALKTHLFKSIYNIYKSAYLCV